MFSTRRTVVVIGTVALALATLPAPVKARPEPGFGGARGVGGYGGGAYGVGERGGFGGNYTGGRGGLYGNNFDNRGVWNGYGYYRGNPGYLGGGGQGGYLGQGGGGNGGNNQGYPYNPYVIVPYQMNNGGNQPYGGGYQYGPNGPPPNSGSPPRRFAPANSNYLYGQDGSVSFYATPPGNETPTDPPAGDSRNYYTPDTGNYSPPPVPVPSTFARVLVRVPPEAHLWFEGAETKQSGADRTFKSTPLDPGRPYLYDVKARWWQDGKPVVKTRTITVWAGGITNLDLTTGD